MSASSMADALAQCAALGVDLRRDGKNMSACVELMQPFCPFGVEADTSRQFPRCGASAPSASKAAALLKEAQARQAAIAGPPWLLIGAGVALAAVVAAVVVHAYRG